MGSLWIGAFNTAVWLAYEWLCARHRDDVRLRRGKRLLTPVLGCTAALTWAVAVFMIIYRGTWGLGALSVAAFCLCVNWSILCIVLRGSPRYFIGLAHRIRPSKWPADPTEKDIRSVRNMFLFLTLSVDLMWIAHAAMIIHFCFSLMQVPVKQ